MKEGDKVKVVVTWNTGEIFGELKAEKEYEIGSRPVRSSKRRSVRSGSELNSRTRCLANLKQMVVAIMQYSNDHNEMFPEKLSELYPRYAGALELFQCPSSGGMVIQHEDELDSYSNYLYNRASFKDGPRTPVVCDKPANHNNEGVNIGFIDGSAGWYKLTLETKELLTKHFGVDFSNEQVQSRLTVVPGVGMGPVKFGMSKDDVIKALGEPDLIHGGNLIYASKGFNIFIREGRGVTNINCRAKSVYDNSLVASVATDFTGVTNKGIGLGSNESQIIKAYGKPTRRSEFEGAIELRYKTQGLYFKLSNDELINFQAMK